MGAGSNSFRVLRRRNKNVGCMCVCVCVGGWTSLCIQFIYTQYPSWNSDILHCKNSEPPPYIIHSQSRVCILRLHKYQGYLGRG